MRRLLQTCIILVLALSCWQSVLASALCPHMPTVAVKNRALSEQNSAPPKGHCSKTSKRAARQQQKLAGVLETRTPSAALKLSGSGEGGESSCENCCGPSEKPVTPASEMAASTRNGGAVVEAPQAIQTVALPLVSFVKEIIPYEVGPPPTSVSKHVLISLFLI